MWSQVESLNGWPKVILLLLHQTTIFPPIRLNLQIWQLLQTFINMARGSLLTFHILSLKDLWNIQMPDSSTKVDENMDLPNIISADYSLPCEQKIYWRNDKTNYEIKRSSPKRPFHFLHQYLIKWLLSMELELWYHLPLSKIAFLGKSKNIFDNLQNICLSAR